MKNPVRLDSHFPKFDPQPIVDVLQFQNNLGCSLLATTGMVLLFLQTDEQRKHL